MLAFSSPDDSSSVKSMVTPCLFNWNLDVMWDEELPLELVLPADRDEEEFLPELDTRDVEDPGMWGKELGVSDARTELPLSSSRSHRGKSS